MLVWAVTLSAVLAVASVSSKELKIFQCNVRHPISYEYLRKI